MRFVHTWAVLCVAAMAAGCGQKGPLLLPDAAAKHKKSVYGPRTAAPAAKPAPTASGNPADEPSKP